MTTGDIENCVRGGRVKARGTCGGGRVTGLLSVASV
jgi:hypothetical protein